MFIPYNYNHVRCEQHSQERQVDNLNHLHDDFVSVIQIAFSNLDSGNNAGLISPETGPTNVNYLSIRSTALDTSHLPLRGSNMM